MNDPKLKKLQDILNLLQEGISKQDFLEAFQSATELILQSEIKLTEKIDSKLSDTSTEIDSLKGEVEQAIQEMKSATDSTFATLKKRALESITELFARLRITEQFNALTSQIEGKLGQLDATVATLPSKDEFLALIPPAIELEKETAEETRDLLETLTGNERLDKSAIKGIEELEKTIAERQTSGSRAGWGAHPLTIYDGTTVIDKNARIINFGDNLSVTRNASGVITVSGTAASGITELTATGTVNGVNANFTFIQEPTYIVSDGVYYKKLDNNGGVQWSWSGSTATLTVPPSYSIYGIA